MLNRKTELLILCAFAALSIPVRAQAPPPTLGVSFSNLTFTYQPTDTKLPSAQMIQVTASKGVVDYTVVPDPTAPWLVISPLKGNSPSSLTFRVNPSSLPAGIYKAAVSLTSTTASNSPTVNVTLVVKGAPPTLTASPSVASFTYVTGAGSVVTPAKIPVSLTSNAQAVSLSVKSSVSTWLKVSADAGVAVAGSPFRFDIFIDPTVVATLQPKTYTANVTITPSDSVIKPVVVPVTLAVTQGLPAISSVWPASVPVNSASAVLTLSGANYFPNSVITIGSKELSAIAMTYVSSSVILVNVPASVLSAPGSYNVTVRNGSTTSLPAVFTVTQAGPSIKGVVNAASYSSTVSPGEIVSIFGAGLGPIDLTPAVISGGKYPVTVADTKVQFETSPGVWTDAPIIFAKFDQVNAIVPWLAASSLGPTLNARVTSNASAPIPVWDTVSATLASADPGIFTVDASGSGQAAVLNAVLDANSNVVYSLNSKDNPALKGSTVVIYITGGGILTPAVGDGDILAAPGLPTTATPVVTVDGIPCTVAYAGGVDGSIAGLVQLNAVLPGSLVTNSTAQLVVSYGVQNSQAGVTIAVK